MYQIIPEYGLLEILNGGERYYPLSQLKAYSKTWKNRLYEFGDEECVKRFKTRSEFCAFAGSPVPLSLGSKGGLRYFSRMNLIPLSCLKSHVGEFTNKEKDLVKMLTAREESSYQKSSALSTEEAHFCSEVQVLYAAYLKARKEFSDSLVKQRNFQNELEEKRGVLNSAGANLKALFGRLP